MDLMRSQGKSKNFFLHKACIVFGIKVKHGWELNSSNFDFMHGYLSWTDAKSIEVISLKQKGLLPWFCDQDLIQCTN